MSTSIVTTAITEGVKQAAPVFALDFTIWFSVITVCIAVVAIVLKFRSEKARVSEQALRESPIIVDIKSDIKKNHDKIELVKEDLHGTENDVTHAQHQIEILSLNQQNSNRTIEELKANNKEILKKLEDLVKQLYEFLSQN